MKKVQFANEAAVMTAAPISPPPRVVTTTIDPEFIRLPKPGTLCPYTGLSRSAMNNLVLPCNLNGGHPPVRSFVLRQKGAATGIRLIDFASLKAHIRKHPQEAA